MAGGGKLEAGGGELEGAAGYEAGGKGTEGEEICAKGLVEGRKGIRVVEGGE